MSINRSSLLSAAYGVGTLLVILPLADVLEATWPLRPSQLHWRFGMLELLGNLLLLPLLGTAIVVYTALLLEHWRLLQMTAFLNLLVSIALVAASPLYSWEAVQVQALVRPEATHEYSLSTVKIAVIYLLMGLTFGWLSLTAIAIVRKQKHVDHRSRDRRSGMMVTGFRPHR